MIVPLYIIQDDINDYIENWFSELPIRKLFLGIGKKYFNISDKYRNDIEFIYQKEHKTLGMCIVELMSKVRTKWFVYLHSDVKLTPYSFEVIKKYMKEDVGGIEGSPILVRNDTKRFLGRYYIKRAYSGFQAFKTEAVPNIIKKIEDDFVYRNEDIIFQNAILIQGLKYEKSWAMYLHINEGKYIRNEKDAHEMFLGLLKYTDPHPITIPIVKLTIGFYNDHFKHINVQEVYDFIEQNNDKWILHLNQFLEGYK